MRTSPRMLLLGALVACAGDPLPAPIPVSRITAATFHRAPAPLHDGAALDVGPPGSWNDWVVGFPTVVLDHGVYRMWFTGQRTLAPGADVYLENGSIGLASSGDGLSWTVANNAQPVFGPGSAGAFDSWAVFHPFVLNVGGTYYLWYGGADGSHGFNSVRVERIGLATSPDGLNWSRANGGQPVLGLGDSLSMDAIQATGMHVIHDGNRFIMWYGAYNGLHTIAAASSSDGIHWTRLNGGQPLTSLDPGGSGAVGPTVYFDDQRYLMLYTRLLNQAWQLVGAMSDDGLTWVPAWGGQPILAPSTPGSFDEGGPGRNSAVHPSQLLVESGRVRFWYMGEEAGGAGRQRIGFAEATLDPATLQRAFPTQVTMAPSAGEMPHGLEHLDGDGQESGLGPPPAADVILGAVGRHGHDHRRRR